LKNLSIFNYNNYFVVSVKGIGQSQHAGIISAIANQANKLNPDTDEVPVICIETENSKLLIRNEDQVVLGIYKAKH